MNLQAMHDLTKAKMEQGRRSRAMCGHERLEMATRLSDDPLQRGSDLPLLLFQIIVSPGGEEEALRHAKVPSEPQIGIRRHRAFAEHDSSKLRGGTPMARAGAAG